MASYESITPPTLLPVSLDDAKGQLRVLSSDEDDRITRLIKRAANHIEIHCGIALAEATWRLKLDAFPTVHDGLIEIRKPPVQSISSITYIDAAGVSQTIDAADYESDLAGKPPRLRPVSGQWPESGGALGNVTVTFVAGHGDNGEGVADIPESAVQLILLLIEQWFEPVEDRASKSQDMAIKALMADLKWAPMAGFMA